IPITMASTSCQFLIPMEFGDQIWIEAGISKISVKSFELTYRIYEMLKGLCAVGTSIQVYYDHQLMQSSAIPSNIKNRLQIYSSCKK
ncbi:MAG: acyl-CoA thioesterase, partial [Nitrososphaera sp.]